MRALEVCFNMTTSKFVNVTFVVRILRQVSYIVILKSVHFFFTCGNTILIVKSVIVTVICRFCSL